MRGEGLEPAHLDLHPVLDKAVLAEDLAQAESFFSVAAVDRGDGRQRVQVHEAAGVFGRMPARILLTSAPRGFPMAKQGLRIEKDSMGELEVPANALWGAQTQRAYNNFPISGLRMPRGFIRALGLIKA